MSAWTGLLRQARIQTGLSRKALSWLSGVSQDTIYSYEHGRRSPSREILLDLCEALKLDGAATNAILEDAGLDPIASPWLRKVVVSRRPIEELIRCGTEQSNEGAGGTHTALRVFLP